MSNKDELKHGGCNQIKCLFWNGIKANHRKLISAHNATGAKTVNRTCWKTGIIPPNVQAPVVQTMDSAIHQINH